jgi:hypothetical protein
VVSIDVLDNTKMKRTPDINIPEDSMQDPAAKTTFFSLPTELRLKIAGYVLEQKPNAAFILQKLSKLSLDPGYMDQPKKRLSIRLVCRQFNHDFTRLAFHSTTFIMSCKSGHQFDKPPHVPWELSRIVRNQPDELVRDVRNLVIDCAGHASPIMLWQQFPFNRACMHLDKLSLLTQGTFNITAMADIMRQLQNIKMIRFIKHRQLECYKLMAIFLGRDHYHRYDAPDAPNVGYTWWDWSYSKEEGSFICTAQDTMPVMEEREYMLFVKPKVDKVMECIANLTS